jgi:hypothetical protein
LCWKREKRKRRKLWMIVLGEREKGRKLWMIVINGLTENLSGNRSGRAGLKEGADVAVGE